MLLGVPVLVGLYLAARRRVVDMLRERARRAEADRYAAADLDAEPQDDTITLATHLRKSLDEN